MSDAIKTGNVREDFLDLLVREEKATGIPLGFIDEYDAYTDDRKVVTVLLFNNAHEFIGGGTAVKSPADKFDLNNGMRIAARKALRSVTGHEKKPNGKRVRMNG